MSQSADGVTHSPADANGTVALSRPLSAFTVHTILMLLTMARRAASIAVVVITLSAAAHADPTLQLAWTAPAACASPQAVREQAEHLALVAATGATQLVAVGTVTEEPSGLWHLTLVTERAGVRGSRELRAESCGALTEAAVLILALTLNPEAAVALSSPSPSLASVSRSPASHIALSPPSLFLPLQSSRPRHLSPQRRERARQRWQIEADLAVETGTLPGWNPGARVAAAGIREPWQARLSATAFWPTQAFVFASTSVGGDVLFATMAAEGCYEIALGVVRPAACAGMELGFLRGQGRGVALPAVAWDPWLAAFVSAAVSIHVVGAFWFRAEAAGAVGLVRPAFYLQGIGTVYSAGLWLFRANLGPLLYF